ncbi:MAG: tRNA pseudouridine(55) synthase TruB [Patescibacteria group bacterium]|nr:tRNA pseudouridine(55) synthase TruB [Patescibacteria group bacterium]
MEKVFVVNKPKGKTSYQVVSEYKRRFIGEKVGHAGTLDPLAEGVLIILVGKATKKQSEFMAMKKEYLAEASFGVVTPTWDLEGGPEFFPTESLKQKLENLSAGKVSRELLRFVPEFEQTIPAFSAVKVSGRRLYRLARKGKVDLKNLPKRKAMIYRIKLESFTKASFPKGVKITPQSLLEYGPKAKIRMEVGKGTYVRSLVYQLGRQLGVGATTSLIIRTRIGQFRLSF